MASSQPLGCYEVTAIWASTNTKTCFVRYSARNATRSFNFSSRIPKALNVNISVETELRTPRVEKWPCNLFTDMMKDQAVSLLRALILVKPEGSFLSLERGATILSVPPSPRAAHADPALLLTLLERGEATALDRAKKGKNISMLPRLTWTNGVALRSRRRTKRKALTSREQTGRAFFAKSAIMWAIASGSPAFYGETVIWTRRFVRDPVSSVILKVYRHERAVTASCASGCSLDSCEKPLHPSTVLFCSFLIVLFLSLRELEAISSLFSSPTVVFLSGLDADAFPIHSRVVTFLR